MPFLWAGHVSERVYHHVHVSSYSQSFEAILPANYESDTSPSHFLYALFQIILINVGMGQNPIPLVHIKIAGKWMFIPLKMVCIGIDP